MSELPKYWLEISITPANKREPAIINESIGVQSIEDVFLEAEELLEDARKKWKGRSAMSSETKSRAGRTAEQVVNEWRESGSQDWGQLVSAINYWAVTDMCPALESSSSADTGGREAAQMALEHDRTKVAECLTAIKQELRAYDWLIEGCGSYEWDDDRWHGEFKHASEAIWKAIEPMVKIAADWSNCPSKSEDIKLARAADPGTTGAEGLRHGVNCKKEPHVRDGYLHDERDDTPYDIDGQMYCGRCHTAMNWQTERAATQRAPVTPPVPVCPQCGKLDCIRQRVMNGAPAPVTTPGRDGALEEVRVMLEEQREDCLEAVKHTALNAIRADELDTALINLRALAAAKEPK